MVTSSSSSDISSLQGKFVVLAVTGGIAAYKAAEICRQLMDAGAHVAPVMTKTATKFLGPTTLSALAAEPVHLDLFEDASVSPHTKLGQAADLVVVAPATARFIAAYAAGLSDDLLGTMLLATTAPVLICPAMHTEMWNHPSVKENVATLLRRGVVVVQPEAGHLAGGDIGEGRLAEPSRIVARAAEICAHTGDLSGLHVVITAGGTREPIDPVRFISNRSSGKQGYALAERAARRGAEVTLISTVNSSPPPGVAVVAVETTEEMLDATLSHAAGAEIVIMAAAVADFRVAKVAPEKLKRRDGLPVLDLEPTPDILTALVAARPVGQLVVGFAAETENAVDNASLKLAQKGIDVIVVNDVAQPGVGFGHDTNAVSILSSNGARRDVGLTSKLDVADAVLDVCLEQLAGDVSN
jgi:phosphopantothenoylcysteine decarboxylase/phosphopantothenate--cysteine ligase